MSNNFLIILCLLSGNVLGQWQFLESGTDASFRSIAVVNKQVVWAGGSNNTVIRTINGGASWQVFNLPHESSLDFRGIVAFDELTAIVFSAGLAENGQALVFRTIDGGENWTRAFETRQEGVFLDGIAFFDRQNGLIIGDPLEGVPYLLETKDAGKSWSRMPTENLPMLTLREASFAASNSGIFIKGNRVWYGLQSRFLYSKDRGKHWELKESGFPSGETKGIFGLHFWTKNEGLMVGGDYKDDLSEQVNIALTDDAGKTWKQSVIRADGLKESSHYYSGKIIVVGTSGTSYSLNEGKTWLSFDQESFHAISCASQICYAIGANGRLAKLNIDTIK